MSADPTQVAREAAERIARLRIGDELVHGTVTEAYIAHAISSQIMAFRQAALEEAAAFVEDDRNEERGHEELADDLRILARRLASPAPEGDI